MRVCEQYLDVFVFSLCQNEVQLVVLIGRVGTEKVCKTCFVLLIIFFDLLSSLGG